MLEPIARYSNTHISKCHDGPPQLLAGASRMILLDLFIVRDLQPRMGSPLGPVPGNKTMDSSRIKAQHQPPRTQGSLDSSPVIPPGEISNCNAGQIDDLGSHKTPWGSTIILNHSDIGMYIRESSQQWDMCQETLKLLQWSRDHQIHLRAKNILGICSVPCP